MMPREKCKTLGGITNLPEKYYVLSETKIV
jgi:hypothetical protein